MIGFAGNKSVYAGPAGDGGVVEAGRKEVLSYINNRGLICINVVVEITDTQSALSERPLTYFRIRRPPGNLEAKDLVPQRAL